ncbi:helix-turn-helix domain-containing protein [Streptomyces sp. NPDC021356]|uniref:AraC-like ligand-binding domain-containing protein n=1 Tax=Streptomyces sp. NPDC021356 TaxID=3154900 RepID=UPI0033FF5765
MELALSTDAVPDRDRLDRWRAALGAALVPMAVTPRGGGPLSGRITGGRLGHLRVCSLAADAQRMSGTAAHHPARDEGPVAVLVLTAGTATLLQDGRHAVAGAGDLLVYDTARPYTLDFPERFACHLLHLPRRGLEVSERELRGVMVATVAATDGIGAVLGPFLARLLGSAHSYGPAVGARLAVTVMDLFATLVAERSPSGGAGTGRGELVLRIRDHIDRHLEDPGLAPETVAAAHHISVRYLHRLFEDEGITVARLIQRRRLQECARELARGGRAAPAVAAVAHRWGFVNPAHFSRVFRGMYGHTPSEWRRLGAPGTPAQGSRDDRSPSRAA